MERIKYDINLVNNNSVIEVFLNTQANVMLMTLGNYNQYKNGCGFNYLGGLAKVSPYKITTNLIGHYILVIDLGGHINIQSKVNII